MKVFVSWSGRESREVAEALHWWLPKVIQSVEPFVSAKDIDKGANWSHQLTVELESSNFGVICMSSENLSSPWLHYEAGAISKSVDSRVCPVLFGVTKAQISSPINQMQMTEFDIDDVGLMMASINLAAGAPLSDAALSEAVQMWWPKLEERLAAIVASDAAATTAAPAAASEPTKPESNLSDLVGEVLEIVRRLDDRKRHDSPAPAASLTNSQRRAFTQGVEEIPGLSLVGVQSSNYEGHPEGWPAIRLVLTEKPSPDVVAEVRALADSLKMVARYVIRSEAESVATTPPA